NKAKIQITDLINESVSHAVARRQKAIESEGFETDLLLDEEQDCDRIKGGTTVTVIKSPMPIKVPPHVVGFLSQPQVPIE
ncbi:MAG: hypothetical protein MUD14_19745, partial [Hydrococcus sp. Prado102]|nr:hypothetical protein [Hydrococcus sp. Prado102]